MSENAKITRQSNDGLSTRPQTEIHTTIYNGVHGLRRSIKSLYRKTIKLYMLVCVCMQSKACHLELTMGMTAEELILSIERIVARRGSIDKVHSDNGPNFAHTGKLLTDTDMDPELESSLKEVNWKKVQAETTHGDGIKECTQWGK
jgi:hypothetical protein